MTPYQFTDFAILNRLIAKKTFESILIIICSRYAFNKLKLRIIQSHME